MSLLRPSWLLALSLGLIAGSALLAPLPFRYKTVTALTPAQAKNALQFLRQDMENAGKGALPPDLEEVRNTPVTAVFTVWQEGVRDRVDQATEAPLRDVLKRFGAVASLYKKKLQRSRVRLQLDVVAEEGWIPQDGLLASLAFVEGRDGVSGIVAGKRVYLPPSELIRNRKYGSFRPLPKYDGKFRIGVDLDKTRRTIRHQAKRIGIEGESVSELARFRALSIVEGEDLAPRRLLKGTVERPPVSRAEVLTAVLRGARYLVRALRDDGMYRYHYNPLADKEFRDPYNWPRHAGVTYSLALVGRLLEKQEFVEAARKSLVTLEKQMTPGPEGSLCLMSKKKCYLGSSALSLLALAEYRIASGDGQYDTLAMRLARFLLYMQKTDGLFYHDWYPEKGIDKELMKLYASQQAIFALARFAEASGEKDALAAAEKGMDTLAGPYWDHFLGSYFFGQEHWTCLAAEEVYRARPRAEYAELCYGIGQHYDRITHNVGETPFAEDVGGMSITHFFTPHLGGTATAAEAMVSSVVLGESIGQDTAALREQLRCTFGFLIQGQVSIHDSFWLRDPTFAVGGILEMQSRPKVRIDNVQHAISAMVRGLDYIQ